MPAFEEEAEPQGFDGILHFFASLLNSNDSQEDRKLNVVRNEHLLAELRAAIQKFERLIRVFEMTYLDLAVKLEQKVQEMNL